jgi:hypothetical protein
MMRRSLPPVLLALTALATALTTLFPWERLEGTDAPPGFIRYEPPGYDLQEGRWLIAVALAGLVWTVVYMRSRNLYIALAALGLAAGGLGVSVTAIGQYGLDAVEPLIASATWFAAALLVVWLQWWEDGRSRPVVLEILGDFEFDHFLTTAFVGLLWALALASSVVGVFVAAIEAGHEESVVIGVVAGGVVALGSIVWLLLVRLLLETVVVLFRIHGEIYLGNARAFRSEIRERQGATAPSAAPGSALD